MKTFNGLFFMLLCFMLLCLCHPIQAQQVSWVVSSGGPLSQIGMRCGIFADGSVLNSGVFRGQTNFYPGYNTPGISLGGRDVFVQKLDTNGITQWVVTFGGKGHEISWGMAIDGDGNILLAGTYTDTCDFNPGSGVDIGVASGETDMFLVKLDASGNYMWSRRFGGSSHDEINGLAVDPDGNIFIGGNFTATVNFSTDSTPDLQHSFGAASGFVMKLNVQGERQWLRKYGNGIYDLTVKKLAVTNSKLWVLGVHSEDSLNFGSALEPVWVYSSEPDQTFLLQLDLQGNATQVGAFSGYVHCQDFSTDINGNILLTGFINGNVDLDPGAGSYPVVATSFGDLFIIKLDSNADFLWAKNFASNLGFVISGYKVTSFEQGDVLLLADLKGTVDFDPGPGVVAKTANGDIDAAVLRLNASGDFVWVHTFGGSGADRGAGLCVDAEKFYVTGSFASTVDFNPGGPPYLLTANGGDAYLIKFGSYSALSSPEHETLQHKIYPNPSTGLIRVEGEYDLVQLLNLQGQMVYQQPNLAEINTLDFTSLNEGVYLLKLMNRGRVSHHKVVIQR